MKVKVNPGATLNEPTVEGRNHKPGAVITVDDKRGEQLVSAGAVVKHEEPAAAQGQGKEAGKADSKDKKDPKAQGQGKEAGK